MLLALSGLLPSIPQHLVRIIEDTLQTSDAEADYEKSPANAAFVLRMCLHDLSKRKPASWIDLVDLRVWTEKIVDEWSWSEGVMEALSDLIRARYVLFLMYS